MRLWKWGNDIHNTGYRIFTLFYSRKLRSDLYLFHYPQGSWIPKHKDPAKYGPHFRLNLEIVRPKKGGVFKCQNVVFSCFNGRLFLFRADANYHSVSKIEEGSRWVLSFGFT